jgi:hypothetical protein
MSSKHAASELEKLTKLVEQHHRESSAHTAMLLQIVRDVAAKMDLVLDEKVSSVKSGILSAGKKKISVALQFNYILEHDIQYVYHKFGKADVLAAVGGRDLTNMSKQERAPHDKELYNKFIKGNNPIQKDIRAHYVTLQETEELKARSALAMRDPDEEAKDTMDTRTFEDNELEDDFEGLDDI